MSLVPEEFPKVERANGDMVTIKAEIKLCKRMVNNVQIYRQTRGSVI